MGVGVPGPLRERLLDIFLTTPDERMFAEVLDLVQEKFQSEFGYFGYIDSAGDLVCPSMTREIFARCDVIGKDIVFPRSVWGGLWGRILVEQVTLFKNAPHATPEGHLPLHRSLGTPILHRQKLIGQIMLANRDRDYGEHDALELEQIGNLISPVLAARLQRDEMEMALRRTNESLEGMVAERTRRLTEANDRLTGEISQRKAAEERFRLAVELDITERKRAADALSAQAQELRRSNEELARFAYVSSHDLKEPLRALSLHAQLLASRYSQRLDAEAKGYLDLLIAGASRMRGLIDDLLSYAAAGKGEEALGPVCCTDSVRQAMDNLETTIGESGAVIHCGELPVVDARPTQLCQVFQNLIGNAIKFSGGSPPRIRISSTAMDREYRISVRDSGIGIRKEYHEKIFEVFRRLHGSEEYPGSGIGLAICKKIIELHGGRIWVESDVGKGSEFLFTVPSHRSTLII